MNQKDKQHAEWQDAVERAYLAGEAAAVGSTPTPMVVGTPKDPLASLLGKDDGGFDLDKPTYYVADGVCGFAWINVKDRKFNNWLLGRVKTKYPVGPAMGYIVGEPRPDSYYGGVSLWISGFGQSMQRKEAFARAFARSLYDSVGISARAMSRMD
jgi:hypothetical protein